MVKHIRRNFWAGRTFKDFDDIVAQAVAWKNQIANQREHRSTRRIIRLVFEGEEKAALMAMNPNSYDSSTSKTSEDENESGPQGNHRPVE